MIRFKQSAASVSIQTKIIGAFAIALLATTALGVSAMLGMATGTPRPKKTIRCPSKTRAQ